MDIILAQPRGFCAGVVRAIEIVERALHIYPHPVYVLHEIVHNSYVVNNLRERGAVFVESLDDVPLGATCIFSAHGVATTIVTKAEQRQLHIIDATCPLVTKVHSQAQRFEQQEFELIIIGHAGHPEVEGTRGCVNSAVHVLCTLEEVRQLKVKNPHRLAYVTQTTLSVDDTYEVIAELIKRFPTIQGPSVNDICYATQNRQNAVRQLAAKINILLVVGAHNSSNSNRLREVGEQTKIASYLIENETDLQRNWFGENAIVGITAAASAPEILINQVLKRLSEWKVTHITEMPGKRETTEFKIPVKLIGDH